MKSARTARTPADAGGGTGRATIRQIVGQTRDGATLMCESDCAWECDACGHRRRVAFTVLSPVIKGHARPRLSTEHHPTLTVCVRCIARAVWRAFRRARGNMP